jgi:hypothetical protein
MGRFVTHTTPKPKDQKKHYGSLFTTPPDSTLKPSLQTLSTDLSGSSTPFSPSSQIKNVNEVIQSLLRAEGQESEPDGATLHCVSISQLCFKHGRITVPPAIVLAGNGYCAYPTSSTEMDDNKTKIESDGTYANGEPTTSTTNKIPLPARTSKSPPPIPYSKTNPPPHWSHIRSLRIQRKNYVTFLREGWKDVREKWWEDAFDGLDERRMRNLMIVQGLRDGIVGARGV